jgi:hypothetical protein
MKDSNKRFLSKIDEKIFRIEEEMKITKERDIFDIIDNIID